MKTFSPLAVSRIWLRYFDVFLKDLKYSIVVTFAEPLLYLVSFGYGMGKLIGDLSLADGTAISYRTFVFTGIVGQTVMFQAYFDGAYGSFIRMYYQRIFKAMATTPITLSEVLWGELLWDASKATFSASAVLLIGVLTGDFPIAQSISMIPVCFVAAFLFAGLGVGAAALAGTIEQLSYPQYLFVFPMFLFCGVYFPLEQLPLALQYFAWALPLTPFLAITRALLLGFPLPWFAIPLVIAWTLFLVPLARKLMSQRLVK